MVVAHYLDQWLKKRQEERIARAVAAAVAAARAEAESQGMEQGLARGIAQASSLWEEWNGRRLAAEAAGMPFDEPPPSLHPNGQENQ